MLLHFHFPTRYVKCSLIDAFLPSFLLYVRPTPGLAPFIASITRQQEQAAAAGPVAAVSPELKSC